MMRATMDLIAAYKYDNTILDLLVIPAALDRQTLIDNLLMETAEREILYSNLDFLKQAIGTWSNKNISVWNELYDTTQYDYNPIWNKDGTVIETETRDLKGSNYHTDNLDRTDNLQDKETRDYKDKETRDLRDKETRDLDSNSLDSVYGYNSNTEAPANKVVTEDNGTDTIDHSGTDTIDHTGTNTVNHTGRQDLDRTYDEKTTDTGTIKHERKEQGNIGLTSTQELIVQQQELVKFNLMDYIIDDFQKKFCLGVY